MTPMDLMTFNGLCFPCTLSRQSLCVCICSGAGLHAGEVSPNALTFTLLCTTAAHVSSRRSVFSCMRSSRSLLTGSSTLPVDALSVEVAGPLPTYPSPRTSGMLPDAPHCIVVAASAAAVAVSWWFCHSLHSRWSSVLLDNSLSTSSSFSPHPALVLHRDRSSCTSQTRCSRLC